MATATDTNTGGQTVMTERSRSYTTGHNYRRGEARSVMVERILEAARAGSFYRFDIMTEAAAMVANLVEAGWEEDAAVKEVSALIYGRGAAKRGHQDDRINNRVTSRLIMGHPDRLAGKRVYDRRMMTDPERAETEWAIVRAKFTGLFRITTNSDKTIDIALTEKGRKHYGLPKAESGEVVEFKRGNRYVPGVVIRKR